MPTSTRRSGVVNESESPGESGRVTRGRTETAERNPYTLNGLSVAQLRKELDNAGLDSHGTKPELVQTLQEHLLLQRGTKRRSLNSSANADAEESPKSDKTATPVSEKTASPQSEKVGAKRRKQNLQAQTPENENQTTEKQLQNNSSVPAQTSTPKKDEAPTPKRRRIKTEEPKPECDKQTSPQKESTPITRERRRKSSVPVQIKRKPSPQPAATKTVTTPSPSPPKKTTAQPPKLKRSKNPLEPAPLLDGPYFYDAEPEATAPTLEKEVTVEVQKEATPEEKAKTSKPTGKEVAMKKPSPPKQSKTKVPKQNPKPVSKGLKEQRALILRTTIVNTKLIAGAKTHGKALKATRIAAYKQKMKRSTAKQAAVSEEEAPKEAEQEPSASRVDEAMEETAPEVSTEAEKLPVAETSTQQHVLSESTDAPAVLDTALSDASPSTQSVVQQQDAPVESPPPVATTVVTRRSSARQAAKAAQKETEQMQEVVTEQADAEKAPEPQEDEPMIIETVPSGKDSEKVVPPAPKPPIVPIPEVDDPDAVIITKASIVSMPKQPVFQKSVSMLSPSKAVSKPTQKTVSTRRSKKLAKAAEVKEPKQSKQQGMEVQKNLIQSIMKTATDPSAPKEQVSAYQQMRNRKPAPLNENLVKKPRLSTVAPVRIKQEPKDEEAEPNRKVVKQKVSKTQSDGASILDQLIADTDTMTRTAKLVVPPKRVPMFTLGMMGTTKPKAIDDEQDAAKVAEETKPEGSKEGDVPAQAVTAEEEVKAAGVETEPSEPVVRDVVIDNLELEPVTLGDDPEPAAQDTEMPEEKPAVTDDDIEVIGEVTAAPLDPTEILIAKEIKEIEALESDSERESDETSSEDDDDSDSESRDSRESRQSSHETDALREQVRKVLAGIELERERTAAEPTIVSVGQLASTKDPDQSKDPEHIRLKIPDLSIDYDDKDQDEQPELPAEQVQLDFFNSDIHMKSIGSNRFMAEPEVKDGFALMWSGIRATYGISNGKVAFQVKIINFLSISHLPFEETDPHDVRVGWSSRDANGSLGECMHSFSYSSVGKKATRGCFSNWGLPFHKEDVVTCCLDMDAREISYYKNDKFLGVCFDKIPLRSRIKSEPSDDGIEKEDEGLIIYFPHIASKNCRFEVNFGQQGEWYPLPEGFVFVNDLPLTERVPSIQPPADKGECTVLMMVGLPGAGKTTWVRQYLKDHPNEQWTWIGAEPMLDLMKVNGIARHVVHMGRWDIVMGLIAKSINRCIQLACRRPKNYIIDQTNVSQQARRRKMAPFKDFQRKVAAIVPSDADFANRQRMQRVETGTNLPAEAMLELKSMFSLPSPDTENYLDQVHFIEPSEDKLLDAYTLVGRYNQEGKPWASNRNNRRYNNNYTPVSQQNNTQTQPQTVSKPRPSQHENSEPLRISPAEPNSRPSSAGPGTPAEQHSPAIVSSQVMSWGRPGFSVRVSQGFAGFPAGQLPPSFIPPPPPDRPLEPGGRPRNWSEQKRLNSTDQIEN